ncbi:glycosyl transferase group 1 [Thiorhodococcus drewsii AZ1]|uniref:Glycosyl transferase group 1 n=1 Tax=Thiorhodococcus drewsii AZ1 TaxID=765913 RepID=G2E7R3_9GAMM|nr:glycosyltransferase [Thiorhodococcus drewsii]EGV27861.1 glycosyl transferase group 1 [Thiorhodococcus drewsii AZ1]
MIKSIRTGIFYVFDGLSALLHVGAARNRLRELEGQCQELRERHRASADALDRLVLDLEQRERERREELARLEFELQRQHREELARLDMELRRQHGEALAGLETECQAQFERVWQTAAADWRNAAFERYYVQLGLQRQLDRLSVALIERQTSKPNVSMVRASAGFGDAQTPAIPAHPDNHHLVTHPYTLLQVGPFGPSQAQHRSIDVLLALRRLGEENLALTLASPASSDDDVEYLAFLRRYAERLGLESMVRILSGRSDVELADDYHAADIYLCLVDTPLDVSSGCLGVQRALHHDRLVLAYDSGEESERLRSLLPPASRICELTSDRVADRIRILMRDSRRRGRQLAEQRAWPVRAYDPKQVSDGAALNIRIEGPYDSTYSLALVNSAIANALNQYGDLVTLHSTDGYGDNVPNPLFLQAHPEIDAIRRTRLERVDVTLRNLYPPRTNAMAGIDRVIGPYGWEESGFPAAWIQGFNRRLTGVLCMSDSVRDLLLANGLEIPAVTTGIVADGILPHALEDPGFALPDGYRLLHISSGFPRKGIDVLLRVFAHLPAEIALVIKTFPNPHNDVRRQLLDLGFRGVRVRVGGLSGGEDDNSPDLAPVTYWTRDARRILLIDADLAPGQIAWLYRHADQLVAPSRGEGFGLPMAEAMLFGVPVVTTDYGGQRDFCTPETAWLIDSRLAPAKTHFDLSGSQWAEPSAFSLRQRILEVMRSNPEERLAKTARARDLVQSRYNAQAVAERIHSALRLFAKGRVEPDPTGHET